MIISPHFRFSVLLNHQIFLKQIGYISGSKISTIVVLFFLHNTRRQEQETSGDFCIFMYSIKSGNGSVEKKGRMMGSAPSMVILVCILALLSTASVGESLHNYGDALAKSILFFEGQRSGKLPADQRLRWRKDSALSDGYQVGVDLEGGYYDAGDNIKFGFPMAFTVTTLAWGVLEFGEFMGLQVYHAEEAIRWGTDYLMKATSVPGVVYVQVGDPYADHNCWERPEDMDTPRTVYAVNQTHPGSEVAAETAAALAASAMVFRRSDPQYSQMLLARAVQVFSFADTYRGSYNDSVGPAVCPFYCDFSGYEDELIWAAAWLHKATNDSSYWNYIVHNMHKMDIMDDDNIRSVGEFGWDDKHAGFTVLLSSHDILMKQNSNPGNFFIKNADRFVCTVLPESPTRIVTYSPGGLMFKSGGSNMQHPTSLSFLLLVYARYLDQAGKVVQCGHITANPSRLISVAKSQVDYILGHNPLRMSYMVGYGQRFPMRIHHRGSSLPSVDAHPAPIQCKEGSTYFDSQDPNPNLLVGALVGGPNITDGYDDDRPSFVYSEPTTYLNSPMVGLLGYFSHFH